MDKFDGNAYQFRELNARVEGKSINSKYLKPYRPTIHDLTKKEHMRAEKNAKYCQQKQIKGYDDSLETETSDRSNLFEEKPGSHDSFCKPKNWS